MRLKPEEIEFADAFAAEHGLAALLDHLGLDGLANDVTSHQAEPAVVVLQARVEELESGLLRCLEWWREEQLVARHIRSLLGATDEADLSDE